MPEVASAPEECLPRSWLQELLQSQAETWKAESCDIRLMATRNPNPVKSPVDS